MAIDSGTTLQSTGLAADLARAYVFFESSTGKVKDLVNNVEKAITHNGGAAFGSDSDGDCLVIGSGQYSSVAEDLDPAGGEYSVVLAWKPTTTSPGAWHGVMSMGNGSTWQWALGQYNATNNYYESRNSSSVLQFSGGFIGLSANTFQVLVITWTAAGGPKIFAKGQASPITFPGNTTSQATGAATYLKTNAPGNDGSWPGNYYFFGYSNTAWSDTDAQAVADDIEGQLFAGASSSNAVGSASGTSTVSAVGASIAASTGSAAGVGAASGAGASTAATVGTAAGSATVSGVGVALAGSVGSAAGASAVSGIGASTAASVGTASGAATVAGIGSSTSAGSAVGNASGSATVSGVGASIAAAVGAASGSATVIGISSGGAVTAPSKPAGAPGHRIKFRGRFYDSIRDRHRLARDVNGFLAEKQEAQPAPKAQKKRKPIRAAGIKIKMPPVVLDTREIDELSNVLAQLKARDAQYTAYIAQLRAINESLTHDEEDFLLMVA